MAQDRPPQIPPPHRIALLCSSSSGPEEASGGWPDVDEEAKTGVESVTQFVEASFQQGANKEMGRREGSDEDQR